MRKMIQRRLLIFIPQLLGVSFLVFLLIRLLPGDPAVRLAGIAPTEESIQRIRERLNLDESLLSQYWAYLRAVLNADFGQSTVTGNAIAQDFAARLPGTITILLPALVVAFTLAVGLGLYTSLHPRGIVARVTTVYGGLAGALPDFWLGLLFVYFFYTVAGLAPAPIGQVDLGLPLPTSVTGFYSLDALLEGNFEVFYSSVAHAVLPIATLVFVYAGAILKQTRSAMDLLLQTSWMRFAIACGVSRRTILRYGLRNVLPQVLAVTGVMTLLMVGGTVIVEQIFAWGGLGQYAIQAVQASDYQAIQAFVLVIAVFSLVLNLAVDLLYAALDPRIRRSN